MPKYYTLVGVTRKDNIVEIVFGDPKRSVVKDEMDDYKTSDKSQGKSSYYKAYAIVPSDDDLQSTITADVRDWRLHYEQSQS